MKRKINKRNNEVWAKIGSISVDSGKILIIDPSYLHKDDVDELAEVDYQNPKNIYDRCCKVLDTNNGGEIVATGMATAVVSRTGLGDGIYDVYGFIEDGRVKEIRIIFE